MRHRLPHPVRSSQTAAAGGSARQRGRGAARGDARERRGGPLPRHGGHHGARGALLRVWHDGLPGTEETLLGRDAGRAGLQAGAVLHGDGRHRRARRCHRVHPHDARGRDEDAHHDAARGAELPDRQDGDRHRAARGICRLFQGRSAAHVLDRAAGRHELRRLRAGQERHAEREAGSARGRAGGGRGNRRISARGGLSFGLSGSHGRGGCVRAAGAGALAAGAEPGGGGPEAARAPRAKGANQESGRPARTCCRPCCPCCPGSPGRRGARACQVCYPNPDKP
mmetsp:Transcript_39330/g.100469  ORF Transcript_39330/g.100469 Transcript_39330/m.100469 type:complete len:282 (-) Transcript_39330:1032-1877(-)